jgi:hypothetical protein
MENSGIVPTMPINSGMGFGGDGIWALLIFAMIFNGGFGFGGNGYNNLATTDYVSSEFTQRDIADVNTNVNNGFQNTNNAVAGGFARTNDNICDLRQNVLVGDMNIQNQVLENRYANQLSACQTQRDILTQTNELNTNLLTTALQNQSKMDECCCTLKAQGIENTQKILDALNQNTIDSLRSEVNDLKNTVTANGIGSSIINSVRPYPVPAYAVSSPYVGINGFYGSNWYGNTIV